MFSGFGGGGGGRGGRSRGGRMGGGMPGMGGGFGGGMPGGFGESAGASSAPPPPGEIVRPLALSLEELYAGGTKKLKITRHMRNGTQEERVLEVAYKPGWKKVCGFRSRRRSLFTDRQGTKVKFAGAGNEDEHGQSQ
jgi:DnaJ family protein B protein 4